MTVSDPPAARPRLQVTSRGSGDRHLVLLHGLFGQGKNFSAVAAALVEQNPGLVVHLPDLPNHGHSAWTDQLDYPSLASSVADWLTDHLAQHTGGRSVALAGHSMGGKVAMVLALTHPALVERLAVIDISPAISSGVSGFGDYITALQALDLWSLSSRREADEALRLTISSATTRGFLLQNLRRLPHPDGTARWQWQLNLDLLSRELASIAGWPDQRFEPYSGPVWWLAAEHSDYVGEGDQAAMQALFPRVRKLKIKDAGHWIHADQPGRFVAVLSQFLGTEQA